MSFNLKRFELNFGQLREDWPILRFEEVCMKEKGSIISGPFGSNISSKFFVESGVPVIRGNNLTQDLTKFVDEGFVYVTQEKADSLNTYAIIDDLVFTAAGTVGQVGIITSKCKYREYIISNKQLRARLDKSIVNPLFAYYWFSTKKMNQYINMLNTGSTVPLINLSILKGLPIPVPDLDTQNKIVAVIGSIDKKIETNNKINKKLEEVAQAIFKQWFVDFEFPNENGKPYKSSGGEMIDSELGKIPKGWKVKKVGDIIETALGGTPSRKNIGYWKNGTVAWVNSGKVNEFRIIEPSEFITEEAVKKSSTKLLPKRTTVIAITGATLGQVSLLEIDSCTNQSVIGLKENQILKAEYIYCWMKEEIKHLANLQTGGAQQHINKDNVNMRNIIVPCKEILDKYYKIMISIFDKISNSVFDIRNSTILRDTLLPKLMSGEIRVPLD